MRIISGKKRGLKLLSPMDYSVRPTTDKIKESIFNILFEIGESSVVLDLFCGSGAIGIEFLSRGAEKVYFCDFSDDSIKITKRNLENAGLLTKSIIMKKNYMDCLNYFYSNDLKFDYIFLDPPYKYEYIEKTLDYIWNNNILKEDGIIILETNKDIFVENFQVIKEKKYSKTKVVFLERKK
ncbi:16S rRNA (guanine(966)-N(2))-methyltransferase RsmD [Parvimonas micra]|jgi:RNA methyltransferase, rsmD family|uniref:RNA methyltransferase n=3 Tax=Parvimonas micra TaxID=33033 RepID=A0A0B4S0W7_9FIRM|nr:MULTISPECIES: 16S rRNA (guanine(966)-N(2))-methyltransferase RsmD [Parvimonas]AIZ36497.1 RNA methyltransferase [Parvimonas micra]EDP23681.1 RNA methyltransferase, RsmD family [Parvimonas micra ATCC 33270]MBF1276674.1 16S rRNA (guanine(966)-N(2))-methyltransferase RsmD [Parvimonas micra]MEB3028389.1 16S rRNA (guanine(966)-N(2))-methyltransferase RsmD [Parvimonas micra]MEB3058037.1 16S rRNA (guanine(966)-N(2))-methyltransferase RsmD [Parvimonas sp. D9]